MAGKASEATRESRKNRELRRQRRSLRRAKDRGASDYVQARISHHIEMVKRGTPRTPIPPRVRNREETQRAQRQARHAPPPSTGITNQVSAPGSAK